MVHYCSLTLFILCGTIVIPWHRDLFFLWLTFSLHFRYTISASMLVLRSPVSTSWNHPHKYDSVPCCECRVVTFGGFGNVFLQRNVPVSFCCSMEVVPILPPGKRRRHSQRCLAEPLSTNEKKAQFTKPVTACANFRSLCKTCMVTAEIR